MPSTSKKKSRSANVSEACTSEDIQAQIEAFLSKGNRIEQVPAGVSGQNEKPSRHIVISRK